MTGLLAIASFFAPAGFRTASGNVSTADGMRVAVVAVDKEAEVLAALVEAQLSADGVKLVEREELDRVLQEQELSAGGFTDRAWLVKLGGLLRADAFLLLSVQKPPKEMISPGERPPDALRVRVAETVSGVRFLDRNVPLEKGDYESPAQQAADLARLTLEKMGRPIGEMMPVSVLGVRSIALGGEYEPTCYLAAELVAGALSEHPRVIALEREDLLELLDEKTWTEGKASPFVTSAVILEGKLERQSVKDFTLTLEARGSGESVSVPIDPAEPAAGAAEATRQIVERILRLPPAPARDPKEEAKEFFEHGMLLTFRRQDQVGLAPLRAACALDPDNIEYRSMLFARSTWAIHLPPGRVPRRVSALDMAQMAAELIRMAAEELKRDEPNLFMVGRSYRGVYAYLRCPVSVETDRVRDMNRATRRATYEVFREGWKGADHGPSFGLELEMVLVLYDTMEDLVPASEKLMDHLLLPRDRGGQFEDPAERWRYCRECAHLLDGEHAQPRLLGHLGDDAAPALDALREYAWRKYTVDPDPVVRFAFGRRMLGRSDHGALILRQAGAGDLKEHFAKLIADFEHYAQDRPTLREAAASDLGWVKRETGLGTGRSTAASGSGAAQHRGFSSVEEALNATKGLAQIPNFNFAMYDEYLARIPGELVQAKNIADYLEHYPEHPEALGRSHYLRVKCEADLDIYRAWTERFIVMERVYTRNDIPGDAAHYRLMAQSTMRRFPQMFEKETPFPKPPSVLLKPTADWPIPVAFSMDDRDSYCKTGLHGSEFWVATWGDSGRQGARGESTVSLAGVDLGTGQVLAKWQSREGEEIGSMVLSSKACYLANWRSIRLLPGTDAWGSGLVSDITVLSKDDALPNGGLGGIAPCGERLWVGYSSGLGIYDPEKRTWTGVFNWRDRSAHPLGSGKRYDVDAVQAFSGGILFAADNKLWALSEAGSTPQFICETVQASSPRFVPVSDGFLFIPRRDARHERYRLPDPLQLLHINPETRVIAVLASNKAAPVPAESGEWSVTERPLYSGAVSEGRPRTYRVFEELIKWDTAVLHEGRFWALYGLTQIICLKPGDDLDNALIFSSLAIDGEHNIRSFTSTPYGLVVTGVRSIAVLDTSFLEEAKAAPE